MIRWRTFRLSKPSCLTQVTNTHTNQEVTMFHKRRSFFGKAQNRILHKQHTSIWISFEFEKSRPLLFLTFFSFYRFKWTFPFLLLILPYIWLLCCRWLPRTPYDLGLGRRPSKSNFGGAVFQWNTLNRFLKCKKNGKEAYVIFLELELDLNEFQYFHGRNRTNNVGRCLHRKVSFTKLKA